MSKSILVIDTPESCHKCEFSEFGDLICGIARCNMSKKESNKKPNWCPLRDLPEKKKEKQYTNRQDNRRNTEAYKETRDMVAVGWNMCIDEILKA